ncbi:MAG: amino acid adenylation domain-containing protein, partial [Thermoanaerobaculia bacterium]
MVETIIQPASERGPLTAAPGATPAAGSSEAPALSVMESHLLLAEWCDTAREYPLVPLVHELVAEQARLFPETIAVVDGDRSLTYSELDARANGLAQRLSAEGVGPEARVAVLAARSVELVLAELAVLKAGGCYVPIDPRFPRQRQEFMLADCRASVVLVHPDLAPQLAASRLTVLSLKIDEIPRAVAPTTGVGPENLAYVIYTSGSTGQPKGVEIEHASLIRLIRWHLEIYGFAPGDRATLFSGPSFDVSVWEVWSCLAAGASLHIPEEECRASAPRMIRWLAEHAITHGVVSTPLAELMIGERWPEGIPLRTLTTGGDRLRQWPGTDFPCPIFNIYGPTEGTVVTTCFVLHPGAAWEGVLPPIGRPLANIQVYLLDPGFRPVSLGESGELWIGGGGLGRGYLERPELTAEKFVPDPFAGERNEAGARLYRTGDLARYHPDGNLEFLGRIDFQIKIRGFRIEPGEIEAELVAHPGVREASVLPHDGPGGTRLVAYLAADGPAPETAEIRDFLSARLPEYMVPSAFVWVDALPLTPNGKVDRRVLAAIPVELASTVSYVAPRTPTEEALAGIWKDLLGLERLGIRDPFLHLGGQSLMAVQVLSRVRFRFGVDLPVRSLFDFQTVEALAAEIDRKAPERKLPKTGTCRLLAPRLRGPELPLSFAQQRLWFLDRLQPGSASYNMPTAYRLRGRVEPGALAAALGEIVRRHEALRTRFATGATGPVQRVDPVASPVLPQIDLEGLPGTARAGEELRLIHAEALRPFDLERGPLLRPLLVRNAADEWVLLLSMHHIVSDGWSMGVLLRELDALYRAAFSGEPSPLPELPVQYVDYALWQRDWLQGEVLESQLGYWRQRLAGHPPTLELPADRPRPAVQSFRGATELLSLGTELSERLRALSRRGDAPLFMSLFAGFLELLHRYTGQTDLLVGTPTAGRGRMELEGLIGFFVNTLVLRTDVSGDPTFLELLDRTRETALGAYTHADLPFERLVEELAPERDLSRTPVFQVMFSLQPSTAASPTIGGFEVEELSLTADSAKFDLTLYLTETSGEIAGGIEYDVELFDPTTVRRLARHLEILLAGAAAAPESRLSDLPLLSAGERVELVEWNATDRSYPWAPVHELFAEHARHRPEALAVAAGDRRLTYGELEGRSNRLAHHLRSLGVGPDVVVGICAERTVERVVGIVAVLKAGGAYASFDPAYPPERLALAMEDARAPVLLTESGLLGRIPESAAVTICLDRDLDGWVGDESRPPVMAVDPDYLAYVIFTSGSTGRPKGVAVPHRGLSNLVRWHHETYGLVPEDVGTQVASPAFDVSVWEMWPFLAGGAAQSIPDEETRLSPARMVSWWKRAGVTLAFLPTPLADGILSEEMPADLPVRCLAVAGDRLHRPARPGTPFELSNFYGPAEYSVATTMAIVPAGGRVTIGRPLANTRIHVLDASGRPVPVGVPGELYIAGVGLARGYLWRPELTAERFLPDPSTPADQPGERMYRTGDLVRWLPDGDLDFLGRLDHQVKIRGMRVELGEIESVLDRHPGVREAVTLVPDGRLTAYVVGSEEGAPSVDELRDFLQRQLPSYMVPQAWVILDELPLTPNGKVDRRALARIEVARDDSGEGYAAPRTAAEERLARLWAELLGVERVGVHDDFFRLGGHSLLAVQVLSRMRQLFGVELELRDLFNSPTVEALAAAVDRKLPEGGMDLALVARSRDGELPLSFAQQRLWFLDHLTPGSALYNVPMAYRLRGRVETGALAAALREVVRRHEALRTRFVQGEEGPAQVIERIFDMPLPEVDLKGLPEPVRHGERERLAMAEALRPFDLERGPLLRALLLRTAAEDRVLVLAMHHIVSDGWSMEVMLREIGELYGAALAGEPSPLPELPVQYADFALWQQERLQGDTLERQIAYWRERLAGYPPLLELPSDRPRPAVQTYRGGFAPLTLERRLGDGLRALSQRSGTSLFMTLLGGFLSLLHRYTGGVDLLVGSPAAGRNRMELEGLIGFFVNTLVLRTDLSGDPSFAKLLERVKETAVAAYTHGDLPFERLVEELAPERSLDHSPLFQVAFVLQTAQGKPARWPGIELEELTLPTGTAKFDLTLALGEMVAGGITGGLEHNRDLFDEATARRILDHLAILLAGAVADPSARLSELPILGPAERRALLVDWNATRSDFPARRSIHGLFAQRALQAPEALAVTAAGERITYGELEVRANTLAVRLRAAGVGPETLVALCAERSIGWVTAMLAILKAGGAYVPLDPTYPSERLAFLLADTGASVLLAQERLASRLPAAAARLVLLDGPAEVRVDETVLAEDEIGGDHLAYVIYTSGSTGRPKGVAVPHRAVLRLVLGTDYLQLAPGDRVAQMANASFDAATFELWGPLLNGGSLAILPQEVVLSPAALAADLRRHGIDSMFLTTALFNQMAREAPGAFASLDTLLFGGEAADPGSVRAVLRDGAPRRLVNIYGPTENTTFSTWFAVERLAETAMSVPIGKPVANTRAYVLDPYLRPVPVGVGGSLYLGGEGLARGYLNRPELTAERFVPAPFGTEAGLEPGARLYVTGDLVRLLVDGDIEFLGRADQQVKIRGFRIEPGEIEAVLAGYPAVEEAVVLALSDGVAGKRLVAYAAVSGEAPEAFEVREYLHAKLPDYMIPSAFVWLDALPLTPNGKIDRSALARLEARAESAGYVAPRSGIEQALAELWAELLGLERVGVHDHFFRLGGHSLLAIRVLSRVRRLFGVEIAIRTLFESPILEALARAVAGALEGSERAAGAVPVERSRGRELPLSFAQQRLWFLDRLQPGSSSYNMPMAYRLRGGLRPAALAAALGEIVRRHEALRTRFVEGAAGAVQVIDSVLFSLPLIDLGGLPEPARSGEESRLARVEALRPFDLERGPLLRPLLVRAAADEWVLLLSMHHIVSDGWSMGVLLHELEVLYRAALSGDCSPLPEPPMQYADYALWQRDQLQGEALESQLSYWRERLAGHPPALELPADRPRPAVQTFRGALEPLSLDAKLSKRLRELSLRSGAPLFMTLLSGFLALLHRYTGQTDLLVGTPTAGRGRMELEGLIGFFVNTLVLRTDASGDPTFLELLDRARETALGAYSHAELPFERLVEELAPERDLSRTPLFEVMFLLQTANAGPAAIAGLEVEELSLVPASAKFDLTVGLTEAGGELRGEIEYNVDLFDAATVRRLARHLEILLAGAAASPESRLSDLPLLSAGERAELLAWNATDRSYPWAPVHELFAEHARRRPEALAVAAGDRRLTYGELEGRSNRLAHHLRSLGVGPDVVVGVCAERTVERVVGIVAALKAGGAYASFDPAYPAERLALAMADAQVPVLLTESGLLDRVPESAAVTILLDRDLESLEGDESRPPVVAVDPDHLAYVIFTSGSTGRAKGVAVPHRGLSNLVSWHHETYGLTAADVGTQVASPAFDVSVWELWPLLAGGAALSIPDEETRLSPHRMVSWWKREGITLAFLPTPLADGILSEDLPADLPVRYLVVGGDRLHRSPRPGTPFELSNIYGPAEHSVVTTMAIVPPGGRVTIGRALANTRVHVLDASGGPVPVGVPGELYVAGEGLARGYLWRPELTAERFLPDPFAPADRPGERMYRTGDLVRRLPDGDFDFLGRLDHQVKIRGMRVELGEIESVLGR